MRLRRGSETEITLATIVTSTSNGSGLVRFRSYDNANGGFHQANYDERSK